MPHLDPLSGTGPFILIGDGQGEAGDAARCEHRILHHQGGAVLCRVSVPRELVQREHDLPRLAVEMAVREGIDLAGADLSGYRLDHAYLPGAKLSGAVLDNAILDGADFSDADLTRAAARMTLMRGVVFDRARMEHMTIDSCDPQHCSMRDARAANLRLLNSQMTACDWSGARLQGARIEDCLLDRSSFAQCSLDGAKLRRLGMDRCSFERASMQRLFDPERYLLPNERRCEFEQIRGSDINLNGIQAQGLCLRSVSLSNVSCHGADLREADCSAGVRLHTVNLRQTDLSDANLANSYWRHLLAADSSFSGAKLHYATFASSTLMACDLTDAQANEADLTGIHLSKSALDDAVLSCVILRSARLDDCSMLHTQLDYADLTQASLRGCTVLQVNVEGAIISGLLVTNPETERETREDAPEPASAGVIGARDVHYLAAAGDNAAVRLKPSDDPDVDTLSLGDLLEAARQRRAFAMRVADEQALLVCAAGTLQVADDEEVEAEVEVEAAPGL